jgi:hypothetical protein
VLLLLLLLLLLECLLWMRGPHPLTM